MNNFDEIELDLNALYKAVREKKKQKYLPYKPILLNLVILYWHGFLVKTGIRQRLMYAGFLQKWFKEFYDFWKNYLHGRPIDVLDFHYLRILYRTKFQNIKHDNEDNEDRFLNAWNRPENLYILFSAVWNYSKINYLNFKYMLKYLPRNGNIVEYGCGIAPITQGLMKYLPHRKYNFIICDILQINFIYAIYALGKYEKIECKLLTPYANTVQGKNDVDVIICITVFEHLPNPLEVIKSFYNSLRKKGKLIFDYILSEGTGLDSRRSADQRIDTLNFIDQNFNIIHGSINRNTNMGFTVAIKK